MFKSLVCIIAFSTLFSLNAASKLNRRAVYNMMDGHNIKDQFHPASSNLYSAKDESASVYIASAAPTRAVMRVGNQVMEVEEWVVSGSPEFYQSYKPESVKRDRQMFASRVSDLKHSMRNKIESNHRQALSSEEVDYGQVVYATAIPQASAFASLSSF